MPNDLDPGEHVDCWHLHLEDAEGPYVVHLPPAVFDVVAQITRERGDCPLRLTIPHEGAILVHVERDGVYTRYALEGLGEPEPE
jgi:hypothetical protein